MIGEYYKNPYTMIPLLNSVNKIMKTFKANTIRNSFRLADRLFINNWRSNKSENTRVQTSSGNEQQTLPSTTNTVDPKYS